MSKIISAFTYRIYKIDEEKIVDIDETRLLPEKILTKMSKNEFRCYLKEIKKKRMGLNQEDITIIKKIDKRIRNKETVRKSKQRFKKDFFDLKKEYTELFKKYQEEVKKSQLFLDSIKQCQCCTNIDELQNQISSFNYKYINFEL